MNRRKEEFVIRTTKPLTLQELEAQLWQKDPDVAFRNVSESDFDLLLIDVYDEDGYPFMDEFEYTDACICNSGVERRRQEFLDWQKLHAKHD